MEHFDLIVVGGGPGGSTAATIVAMQGHRVLLVEKEVFPVHKIGESLLPTTVNGICAMLGVSDALAQAGFVRKHGGMFRWGRQKEPWRVRFSAAGKIEADSSFAYQVERMKFDPILLDNARAKGVDVRERHTATGLIVDETGRVDGISFRDADGFERSATSRFVIDASGWTSTLQRHVGTRIYSDSFRNVAVYGYFDGGARLPEPDAGNIFSCAFDLGWFWYIPLSATLTSVGAVIGQEHAGLLRDGVDRAFTQLIERCTPIRDMLAGTRRIAEGPYGEVRVRKDYSYCSSKLASPGIALVGDAACFIDPVFSSGVHLATYSGLLAARSVNSCLAGTVAEGRAFSEFSRRYMREYRNFYDFLIAFYNIDQDVESYYWEARRITNSASPANEAFIELVAGVGGSGEQLYGSTEAFIDAQAELAGKLFPTADGIAATGNTLAGTAEGRRFWNELMRDQLHIQAMLKRKGALQKPLFSDGLIPSVDGFHWAEQEPESPATEAARTVQAAQ